MKIESQPNNALVISPDMAAYHPKLIQHLLQKITPQVLRLDISIHGNGMPFCLVGQANEAVQVMWVNGDNYQEAIIDLTLIGNALTNSPDQAGRNVSRLGVFSPFIELRGHDRTRRRIPETIGRSIVRAEGVNNDALVNLIKHVAGASYLVTVDAHNPWKSSRSFQNADLDWINLTTNQLAIDYLYTNGYLNSDLENTVVTVDLGNLPTAVDAAKRIARKMGLIERLPLSIIIKERIGTESMDQRILNSSVRGKRIFVFDDMISSGKSALQAIKKLVEEGAEEIIFYAPHAVFSGDYYNNLEEILQFPQVKLVMVSDTLPEVRKGRSYPYPYVKEGDVSKEIKVLPVGDWIAEKIALILEKGIDEARIDFEDEIVSPLDPYQIVLELTGKTLSPPRDVAVYQRGHKLDPLKIPDSTE